MKNAILVSIAAALIVVTPALASDNDDDHRYQTSSQHMQQQQIRALLAEEGYDVGRIEMDDGWYEAYAVGKDGRQVELYIDPVSGEVRKVEYDDDCEDRASGQHMEQQQIRTRLAEQGYDVGRIEMDDGCYEAYAVGKDGRQVELYIDPVSGEIRKVEYDD